MILDVHVAYLFAALAVLFGLTYTMNQGLSFMISKAKEKNNIEKNDNEIDLVSF